MYCRILTRLPPDEPPPKVNLLFGLVNPWYWVAHWEEASSVRSNRRWDEKVKTTGMTSGARVRCIDDDRLGILHGWRGRNQKEWHVIWDRTQPQEAPGLAATPGKRLPAHSYVRSDRLRALDKEGRDLIESGRPGYEAVTAGRIAIDAGMNPGVVR